MLRALALLAAVAGLMAAPGARAQDAAARERKLLARVDAELARGHGERALGALRRALEHGPSAALLARYAELALPWRAAESERERGKFAQAGERLLAWLAASGEPLSPALALHAAWALGLRADYAASRELAGNAGAVDPARAARCLRALASLALAQRALGEAQETLSLARALLPGDPELAGELGILQLARGEAQLALGPLGERFAADPRQLGARRDFAYALRAAGRADEAYALLAAAGEACPPAERCQLELARAALEAGRYAEAAAQGEQAARREAGALDALFIAAEAQTRLGERAAARALYQRVLERAPGNLRARGALEALDARR